MSSCKSLQSDFSTVTKMQGVPLMRKLELSTFLMCIGNAEVFSFGKQWNNISKICCIEKNIFILNSQELEIGKKK